MRRLILLFAICVLISACGSGTQNIQPQLTLVPTSDLTIRLSVLPSAAPTQSPQSPISTSPITTPQLPIANLQPPTLDPANWKEFPVIPNVDPSVRAVYEYGQRLGNDPHTFSIFGDCQSRPDAFFGVFENDSSAVANLSPELQETVANFRGSFNRESPTSQDGTTPGALLWSQWHRGEYGCSFDETPVACELRIHHPSFVLIQIGTHFESRNTEYLRKIILQLMDAGVVPILATKADNRELDDRINRAMALLASEYDLPLWNFWAALSDLPNRGLYTRADRPLQGDIYLTEEAALIHRMTGLEALNAVWRMATDK